jgi:hypothetical protein
MCDWVAHCISIVRLSILINGSPSSFLNSSRGLRPGNPLCPMLFVVFMEALSIMLFATVIGALIWFFMGLGNNAEILVSHLLFVDDALICEASPNHLRHLCFLFLCFEVVSRLRINLPKSEFVLGLRIKLI